MIDLDKNINFVFFGNSMFSVYVLNALKEKGFLPFAVVTFPDRPKGRKLTPTPNVVKTWAEVNNIKIFETLTPKDPIFQEKLKKLNASLFVVASFGRILPPDIIYMPPYKTLNVHPSLLPRLRGPAPIQEAILSEPNTGVSIMVLDEGMDTGPLLNQIEVEFPDWPVYYKEAEEKLGTVGGYLLSEVMPLWISGQIPGQNQDNNLATKTRKIARMDGDITNDDPETALKKIKAFEVWPRTFFFHNKKDGSRELLIIRKAKIEDGKLVPLIVIPAGRREMLYEDYIRGN